MFGISFGAERVFTGFKRLEGRVFIAEILNANRIKVIAAHVERQIGPPIVGVALVDDAPVHIDRVDHIRAGPRRCHQTGFIQPCAGFLVPFLGPRRHTAHLINQAAARNAGGEIEFNGMVVDHLDLGNALAHSIRIGFQPLIQQQVVAECDVMRRYRVACRKLGILAHVENHPILGVGIFEAFTQQAIGLSIDIRRCGLVARPLAQQAFKHDGA